MNNYIFRIRDTLDKTDERQWTLGDVMRFLQLNHDCVIALESPHSYRGYYDEMALTLSDHYVSCQDLREELGRFHHMEGWKGGTYHVTEDTVVWISTQDVASNLKLVGMEVERPYVFSGLDKPVIKVVLLVQYE